MRLRDDIGLNMVLKKNRATI